MPKYLGLSGYARSGKDTVAEYLVREHGYTRVAFADALRDALYALNPAIEVYTNHPSHVALQEIIDDLGWESAKTQFPDVRSLLQRLGTEVGRAQFGDNFWVDQAMRKAAAIDGPVVFTDVRFPNEADAISIAGGEVWRIERPGYGPVNGHSSETALDGYDFHDTIGNASDIRHLQAVVDICLHVSGLLD